MVKTIGTKNKTIIEVQDHKIIWQTKKQDFTYLFVYWYVKNIRKK